MNFIYVIHLLYWNQLTDLIIHSTDLVKILVKQNNRNNSGDGNDNGARPKGVRPFVVAVNAVFSVRSSV